MVAAWLLNLGGMALGMLIAPRRTWRAWLRGRRCTTLYGHTFDDALLARPVDEVRTELGLERSQIDTTLADVAWFVGYWQVGAWGSLAVAPLAVVSAVGAAIVGLVRRI